MTTCPIIMVSVINGVVEVKASGTTTCPITMVSVINGVVEVKASG